MNQTSAILIGVFGLLAMALLGHFSPNLDFSLRGTRSAQELAAESAKPSQPPASLTCEQR